MLAESVYKFLEERKESIYYIEMFNIVKNIYSKLDHLKKKGGKEYLGYIASITSVMSEDYADTFPYSEMSIQEIEGYIKALIDLEEEVQGYIDEVELEEQRMMDLETGKLSLDVLGISSLDELDSAIRNRREEKEQQREKKIHSLAAGLSALRGDKSSLISVLDLPGTNPKSVMGEEKADEPSQIDDTRQSVMPVIAKGSSDTGESNGGSNPPGTLS